MLSVGGFEKYTDVIQFLCFEPVKLEHATIIFAIRTKLNLKLIEIVPYSAGFHTLNVNFTRLVFSVLQVQRVCYFFNLCIDAFVAWDYCTRRLKINTACGKIAENAKFCPAQRIVYAVICGKFVHNGHNITDF